MIDWTTRCQCCGAMAELETVRCPYCGTPYPKPRKPAQAVIMTPNETEHFLSSCYDDRAQLSQLIKELEAGAISINQARHRMGLPPV